MIIEIYPKAYRRYLSLPVLGSIVNAFAIWSYQAGYARATIRCHIKHVNQIDRFLGSRGIRNWREVSRRIFQEMWEFYYPRNFAIAGTVRHLQRFLEKTYGLDPPPTKTMTPITLELDRYAKYLYHVRGLTDTTIRSHCRYLAEFLALVKLNQNPKALAELDSKSIESFLISCAPRLNRYSLQHIVAYLRSFLRFQYEQEVLSLPLHTMIDTPRVYRLEKLPHSLPWDTVKTFLTSIDRSNAQGIRDYTMLFLTAHYGLRSCEVVEITLDDIDWRAGTLRIGQRKTGNALLLPLTDAAAEVLIHYLKFSRPPLPYRHLFLRVRAPHGILKPTAVTEVFQRQVHLTQLDISYQGPHCLRHSFASHLLRRGESPKVIGDLLGHRHPESTGVYFRLAIEDLRTVALPVPQSVLLAPLPTISPLSLRSGRRRRNRLARRPSPATGRLRSFLASAIQNYLQLKQSLGRKYDNESRMLHLFDAFLSTHYPRIVELTGTIFARWAATLSHLSPTVRRRRLQMVRNFCLYYRRTYPRAFVPDELTFPPAHPRPLPYIFSEEEIARLIQAPQFLPPHPDSPLRGPTMRLALILLSTSGLRRGELLRLKLEDWDASQTLLRIEATKFHKSRILPLSPSAAEEMNAHLRRRRQSGLPMDRNSALIWNRRGGKLGKSYSGPAFIRYWRALCSGLHIRTREGKLPRIHDVRHSFAIRVLQGWYQTGENVPAKLPYLSTYMGHVSLVSTYYYLTWVEEIRKEISVRCQPNFLAPATSEMRSESFGRMPEGGIS